MGAHYELLQRQKESLLPQDHPTLVLSGGCDLDLSRTAACPRLARGASSLDVELVKVLGRKKLDSVLLERHWAERAWHSGWCWLWLLMVQRT